MCRSFVSVKGMMPNRANARGLDSPLSLVSLLVTLTCSYCEESANLSSAAVGRGKGLFIRADCLDQIPFQKREISSQFHPILPQCQVGWRAD